MQTTGLTYAEITPQPTYEILLGGQNYKATPRERACGVSAADRVWSASAQDRVWRVRESLVRCQV
jgi:hypothetical protein